MLKRNLRKFAICLLVAAMVLFTFRESQELRDDTPRAAYLFSPSSLSDSGPLIDRGIYKVSSPFARLIFTTDARTVVARVFSSMATAYASISKFGVYVDGRFLGSFSPPGNGLHNFYLGLDGDYHTVEVIAGPDTITGGALSGNYIVSVSANAPVAQQFPIKSKSLWLYGDSITVGDGTGSAVQTAAYPMLLRKDWDGSVGLEAWGARTLYADGKLPTGITALVAAAKSRNPTVGAALIGTNDYGLNAQSASDFGTMYGTLLDEWHAQMPEVPFIGVSPLARAKETANSFGDTLDDYRASMHAAFSARPWATFVDGKPVLTNLATQTDDGLHPNTTGTPLVEDALLALLP